MGRPIEQSMKCLQRDLDWARRMKKRARDAEHRTPEKYELVMKSLKNIVDTFEEELDADARARERSKRRTAKKQAAA